MNLLAGRDATIVSSSPGTTRDVVEIMLDLGGGCTILDTAGVREEEEDTLHKFFLFCINSNREHHENSHNEYHVKHAFSTNYLP